MDLFHRISKWSDRVPSPDLIPLVPGQGVPGGAQRAPGAGVPRARLGRAVQRRRRVARCRFPGCTGRARGWRRTRSRWTRRWRCSRAAERPAMIAGSSVWWDDAPDALRAFVERAQVPAYLNGAGPRLPAARPPDVLPAHPQGGAHRGGRGVRDRHAVRLPPQLRQPSPPSARPRRSSRWTSTPPRWGATGRWTWASSPTAARRSRPSPTGRRRRPATAYVQELRAAETEEARGAARSGPGATPFPSTTTGWRRSSRDVANAGDRDPMFIADGGNWVAMAAKVLDAQGSPAAGSTRGRWAASAWARRSRWPRSCCTRSGRSG